MKRLNECDSNGYKHWNHPSIRLQKPLYFLQFQKGPGIYPKRTHYSTRYLTKNESYDLFPLQKRCYSEDQANPCLYTPQTNTTGPYQQISTPATPRNTIFYPYNLPPESISFHPKPPQPFFLIHSNTSFVLMLAMAPKLDSGMICGKERIPSRKGILHCFLWHKIVKL